MNKTLIFILGFVTSFCLGFAFKTIVGKQKYFEPSTKDFMINYRVENLEALVEQLKNEGVTIVDKIEPSDYGKFVHIIDVEGNKVELWEPHENE